MTRVRVSGGARRRSLALRPSRQERLPRARRTMSDFLGRLAARAVGGGAPCRASPAHAPRAVELGRVAFAGGATHARRPRRAGGRPRARGHRGGPSGAVGAERAVPRGDETAAIARRHRGRAGGARGATATTQRRGRASACARRTRHPTTCERAATGRRRRARRRARRRRAARRSTRDGGAGVGLAARSRSPLESPDRSSALAIVRPGGHAGAPAASWTRSRGRER